MANLNKVLLIGRLTRDPEIRTMTNGGKVAMLGFAVNNRRKNVQTDQWEEEPVFLDVEAWNRDQGRKLADLVEQYLRKGNQVFIEGHLRLDQWVDKNDGSKRQRLKIVMDNLQFLEPRSEGLNAEGGARPYRGTPAAAQRTATPARSNYGFSDPGEPPEAEPQPPSDVLGDQDNIPF